MINFRLIFAINGILLVFIGLAMLVPAAVDLAVGNRDWQVFLVSATVSIFVGGGLFLSNRGSGLELGRRQAFLLTTAVWIILPATAALPFAFSEMNISYTDAFFEAMSGLTTTGSTVLTGLDTAPPGILMWRALLQWTGGIGIIVTAIAIMPLLRIGGMQLFRMEASEATSEKALPRVADIVKAIGYIYLVLSLICTFALWMTGMSLFDAVTHAMTTISTGGFSTSDQSAGDFESPLVESIMVVFMILGALPFLMYLHIVKGKPGSFLTDSQVRWFLSIVLIGIVAITIWQIRHEGISFWVALRHATFNVTSIITGTGYATADYSNWGGFGTTAFFFFMFVGGCAGSASCSIKIFRIQILVETARCQLMQMIRPSAIYKPRYNGQPLAEETIGSVTSFVFLFIVIFALLTIALGLTGLDFLTAISSAATSITNVGPGLGETVGPSGTFKSLSDPAKWLMSLGMLLGRLELFTVLVLFSRRFWQR
ncbi:TrkH family potassium uptake protein [Sneathiella sp. HT1-7]|uniref:TrkH family potassium uptake protein n=1 Tax=Sneathiella sp. HT1-7 TaxID=2887192 RepID=UPI001D155E11|nr:TrkH family potassium uptake protein [Sneathiella sp. HT1-7]MCC3304166.1 TrkH family potassium uptake protein [Sneathiella sp. HT1-7]